MDFSLLQLQAFVYSAECGSFSAASRKLRKAHSAVSTAISNLEIDVGKELFDRSARNPVLTPAGEILLKEAKTILAQCAHFEQLASKLSPQLEDKFTIAVADNYYLPYQQLLLKHLGDSYPELELRVMEALSQDVVALVMKEEVDIGFVLLENSLAGSLNVYPLPETPLSYLASPSHPLAKKQSLNLHDLSMHRQVILSRSKYFNSIQVAHKVWKADTLVALAEIAESGHCWFMAPEAFIQHKMDQGALVKLSVQEDLMRSFPSAMIWSESKSSGIVHQAVRRWVKEFSSV